MCMKIYLDQMSVSSSQSSETQEKNDQRETLLRSSVDMNTSVNSSSFADLPPPPPQISAPFRCFSSRASISVFSAFSVFYTLLLPLLILVLYLGFQRWKRRRSTSTAPTSHSDVFTYHCIAMQLNEFLGIACVFFGVYVKLPQMMEVGACVWSVTTVGQALFHLLTCVERYLAVVHPVTYRGLKQAGGVRIRNISIGCVWFLSFGGVPAEYLGSYTVTFNLNLCIIVSLIILVSFCSVSVLYALKRPGPGEVGGGNRGRVDQSKQRAFNTIMVILAVLLLRFGGSLFYWVMSSSSVLNDACVVLMSTVWFDLPSGLVLPLLFLQRAGKLHCCRRNAESG